MSKTYLIEAEKAEWQTHDDLLLQKADGKEVEVLDMEEILDIQFKLIDNFIPLMRILKINNLLIVKIKE